MPNIGKSAVAPLYLFACLLLGGSAQGIWQNAFLQLVGLAIIVWAASASGYPLPGRAKPLMMLAIAGIAVAILQLVPLPASLWIDGPRARLAEGLALLGQPAPMLPVSLSPHDSLTALLATIPPLALFCAVLRLGAYRASWLVAALLAGVVAGIALGALQVVSPGLDSPWYPYRETNRGVGVGFFANANHMADLLVISLPFLAALAAAGKSRNIQRQSALFAVIFVAAVLVIAGIALNGSLAGYVLVVPVLVTSVLIVAPARKIRFPLMIAVGISLLAAIAALVSTPTGGNIISRDANTSVDSRQQILSTTGRAIRETLPFGSGLGSFVKVYPLFEDRDRVTNEYVIHAHNDYAELALELGIAGILLVAVFLAWWSVAAKAAWRIGGAGPYARAASVASAAILVHSLVDFPLRTAAISACFAMCLALLIERRPIARQEANDLRPTRHLTIS